MAGHLAVGQVLIPSWFIKAIVTLVLSASITGAAAWGTRISALGHEHETRISVIEDHQRGIDKSLVEIQQSQLRVEEKLDRVLRRR